MKIIFVFIIVHLICFSDIVIADTPYTDNCEIKDDYTILYRGGNLYIFKGEKFKPKVIAHKPCDVIDETQALLTYRGGSIERIYNDYLVVRFGGKLATKLIVHNLKKNKEILKEDIYTFLRIQMQIDWETKDTNKVLFFQKIKNVEKIEECGTLDESSKKTLQKYIDIVGLYQQYSFDLDTQKKEKLDRKQCTLENRE